jgi:hypothetical protein
MNHLRPLAYWDRGFESYSRHGCLLPTGWSPAQGGLPTVCWIHSSGLILVGNRPQGIIWDVDEEDDGSGFSTFYAFRDKQKGTKTPELIAMHIFPNLLVYWRVIFSGSACHLLSSWFLARLILRPWRWRRYVPPKRRLTLNVLQGVISQKIEVFITTAVRNIKSYIFSLMLSHEIVFLACPPLIQYSLSWE